MDKQDKFCVSDAGMVGAVLLQRRQTVYCCFCYQHRNGGCEIPSRAFACRRAKLGKGKSHMRSHEPLAYAPKEAAQIVGIGLTALYAEIAAGRIKMKK
ncbi:hypothetical protein, partial [Nostoc linckia]|uniref:hypothetical protein n=1 Tax=Nostoc linckia TaxID=92942 RepID=UPI001C55788C